MPNKEPATEHIFCDTKDSQPKLQELGSALFPNQLPSLDMQFYSHPNPNDMESKESVHLSPPNVGITGYL